MYVVVAALVVLVAAGAAFLFAMVGDDGTTVATGQGEIPDADEVLQDATDEFLAAVESSGAVAGDDAGCFWMVTERGSDGSDRLARSVACGPGRFVAGGDWVVAPIDSTASGEDGLAVLVPFERAEFAEADELGIGTGSDAVEFVGIDGAEPAEPQAELGEPETAGRAFVADGRLLDAPDELVAAGTELISTPKGNTPLNVHPGADCWIPDGVLGGDAGSDTTGQLLCGAGAQLARQPPAPVEDRAVHAVGWRWAVGSDR